MFEQKIKQLPIFGHTNTNTYFFGRPISKSKIDSNKFNDNYGSGKSKSEIESSKKIWMETMSKQTQFVPFY